MSFLGGLGSDSTVIRNVQRRVFAKGSAPQKSDRIVKSAYGDAYHVIWGDDGDKYDGEAYFPTLKDALAFWSDTEGQTFSEYWRRVPLFNGIGQPVFYRLNLHPREGDFPGVRCGVGCETAWARWWQGRRNEEPARVLRQTVGEGRAIRSRSRVVGSSSSDLVDTLDQVAGGAYRVQWNEFVSGRPVTREAFFPTLAAAKRFWTDHPRGESFSEWFDKYDGINGHWYNEWLKKGCSGDNAWLCAGAWGKVTR